MAAVKQARIKKTCLTGKKQVKKTHTVLLQSEEAKMELNFEARFCGL
jgi:hypothetical protein